MDAIIRFSHDEEVKALPILLRHSPGTVLAQRTYVVSKETLRALRSAGVLFGELNRDTAAPGLKEVMGERV
jgi:hypothetical protein